ncbi:hypothetical protein AB0G20_24990 [Streptomyces sp. NPDC024017]|uniref:hypothetical protein n=1 Tax=Streptomyces sp. NPDC024017 TaxID=3154326 RepID=UPI0033C28AC6
MKRPHRGEPIEVPTYAAGTSRPPVDGPYEYGNPAHEAIFGVPAERVHEDTRVAWEWVLG